MQVRIRKNSCRKTKSAKLKEATPRPLRDLVPELILNDTLMRPLNQWRIGTCVAARKLVLLFVIGAYILVQGCRGSETIWSAEVQSPDGKMTATARAFGNSGFGINGVDTSVYLNWTTGSQPPTIRL